MKKLVLIVLALIVTLSSMTLQEAVDAATSGTVNGVTYDKAVKLTGGVTYTGGYHHPEDATTSVIIYDEPGDGEGGNAIIDLEGSSIVVDKCDVQFDLWNVVLKNGGEYQPPSEKGNGTWHGAFTLIGNFYPEGSPNSVVRNCTFVECNGAAILSENMDEVDVTWDRNVFYTTNPIQWVSPQNNWIPDGVAVLGYYLINIMGGTYADITDNFSYSSTFTKRINGVDKSGDFWAACITCGGGDDYSDVIEASNYEGVFTGNLMDIDPNLADPTNGNYFALAAEADGRGVLDPTVSIDESLLTESVSLVKNYPNPFNPTTSISFALKGSNDVNFTVFNSKGEMVTNSVYQNMSGGANTIEFNGADLESGVYFYSVEAAGVVKSGKMVLVK